jgi:hypothetical protein
LFNALKPICQGGRLPTSLSRERSPIGMGYLGAPIVEIHSACSGARAFDERRRPTLTQNQVRTIIGGGAKKPVERAFGAVADHGEVGVLDLNDGRELRLFLQSMSVVPQGAV